MTDIRVPSLSGAQMQEVGRRMARSFAIELIQSMEVAGCNLAEAARRLLDQDILYRPIVVLAGRGNTGGSGLAAARHLLNWGADVQVLCAYPPDEYQDAPARQLAGLQAMGAPLAWAEEGWELPPCDLIIDAIIGCGLRGEPHGKSRDLIQLANSSAAPILSLDIPSGLDPEVGTRHRLSVQATATLTLALPKTGLVTEIGYAMCGELYVADIGVPSALYAEMEIEPPLLFAQDAIVPLSVQNGAAWVASAD